MAGMVTCSTGTASEWSSLAPPPREVDAEGSEVGEEGSAGLGGGVRALKATS